MPAAARLGDKAQVQSDAHGCPACPHPCVGPIVVGSTDVFINKLAAARLDDLGVHAACCGPNTFTIAKGSPSVYVNGKPLARMNDKCTHCGGDGPIIEGSPDVLIDDGAGDAAAVAKAAFRELQIKLHDAAEVKFGQAEKKSGTLKDSKESKESEKEKKKKEPEHKKTVPSHEAHEKKHESKKKKEEEKEKKEKAKKKKEEEEKKKKKAAERPDDVEVLVALRDADAPSEPLVSAQVEYIAYGEKHVTKTDKQGKLKAKMKGKKAGTFELIVKTQGLLPAFVAPVHPAPAADAAPDDNANELAIEVSAKQLEAIIPEASKGDVAKYCEPLNAAMFEFEIRSPRRQAAFLAQLAVESGYLASVVENGTGAQYNGRADLGNTHPGDGPKYKGRGLIQITGRYNYGVMGKALGVNLIDHPELLTGTVLACRASAYYFLSRRCNDLADRGEFIAICTAVNGNPPNKVPERTAFWKKAKQVLGNSDKPETFKPAASEQPMQLRLVDAADPAQGLPGAKVLLQAGGKKITALTDAQGQLHTKMVAEPGTTWTATVLEQGVLPPLKLPARPPPPPAASKPNPPPDETAAPDGAVTAEQIHRIDSDALISDIDKYLPYLQQGMAKYHINTPIRRAAFFGNICEESWDFKHLTEQGVPITQFMGRGLIQITGEGNYKAIASALGIDCVNHPDLLLEPKWAALSACYFFWDHKLNAVSETVKKPATMNELQAAFEACCWTINGGNTGLPRRLTLWQHAVDVFGVKP